MEDYRLEQSGQEVQNILNGAAMQSDLTAETERAELAEQTLQGNIDIEESDRKTADLTLQDNIDAEETRAKAAEKQNADDIDALEEKVPSGASASNKLATESYVDDSVATATATFRGTYNLVSDLHLTLDATEFQIATQLALAIATADNNDYCFIQVPTSSVTPTEIKEIDRYKFNGTAWSFEYKLNNSGFTTAQWAAINSGITSGDVTKLANLPTNDQLTTLLAGKQDVLTFDDVPTEGSSHPVKSGGVYSAINDEKTAREAADNSLSSAIEAILLLIPSAATSLNKLADQSFVNSSIATASATFRGTYNLVTGLSLTVSATHAQIATALAGAVSDEDNNDYAFVQIPTSDATPTQIAKTERYKFNGTAWEYEYDLNNSGYTAAQWAAINSGITSALVTKLSDLPTNAELTTALGVLTSSITTINQKIPSAASQANQLVDTAAMEAYIVQVLDVLTASFNITSTDGHVTVQISQVNGKITSFALTTLDIASAASLSLVEGRVTTAEGIISTNSADIAILQDAYAALTQSALVVIASTDTWPVENPEEKTIYRVVDRANTPPKYYSDYMWNGIVMVLMAMYDNAIDDIVYENGTNMVSSKAVYKAVGEAFNVADTFIKPDGTSMYIAGCGWNSTDYIPVLPGSTISITVETNYEAAVLAFYTKTKTFISSIVTDSQEQRVTYSNTITVPGGVAYIRSSAFLFGENLPHSLIIRQNEQILNVLQNQQNDVTHIKRAISNAKLVNYQIVENQENFHIDVIPATFSRFTLSGSTHVSGAYQDIVFAYDEDLTELSGSYPLENDDELDIYVPSTAKYILLTVNEASEKPGKISITDSITPIKRSSIPYTNALKNAFVNNSGNVQTLTGRYYWHVERYNIRPYSQIKFHIPQLDRTGAFAIAFYSGEPSSATFISGYTTNEEESKLLIVPYKAQYMLLSQYTSFSAPITFYVEDFRDAEIETKQNVGVRLYKDKSLVAALRWGDSYPNFHITINGNEQAAIVNDISPDIPSLKSGYFFSADIHFEKVNLTKNDFLILKAQGLVYPSTQNMSVIDITFVAGNIDIVNNVDCYLESGEFTDIVHIVTDGSDYLTQCYVENIKIETLMLNSVGNRLFTELFNKRYSFVVIHNEDFVATSSMSLYKKYRAGLLTYEYSREKEIVLNSDHIVRKPFSFAGKTACFCGDSITRGYTDGTTISENNYVKSFSDAVGLTYTNKAVGGATFAQVEGLAQIGTQVKSITDGQYDFIFIAGGVNDYSRNVDFSTFKTTLEDLCDWINTNLTFEKIIWITPINHAFDEGTGYLQNTYALWQYISIMVEVFVEKDIFHRFSIVKGHKFDFPVYGMSDTYINSAFGDRLHPSELGYQNIYAPGLLNALL